MCPSPHCFGPSAVVVEYAPTSSVRQHHHHHSRLRSPVSDRQTPSADSCADHLTVWPGRDAGTTEPSTIASGSVSRKGFLSRSARLAMRKVSYGALDLLLRRPNDLLPALEVSTWRLLVCGGPQAQQHDHGGHRHLILPRAQGRDETVYNRDVPSAGLMIYNNLYATENRGARPPYNRNKWYRGPVPQRIWEGHPPNQELDAAGIG
ncbi:hypothetical protein DFJ74DRAFT_200013 [Hyaloraphidium curvatum]|nr:hypothetical protein DFJ74DRAFT_200013 [Hyaloraphidium curvatum]